MELLFLLLLIGLMAWALGSGYPVAFALPGASIITILLAGLSGYIFAGETGAFFHQGGPSQWLNAGVTNLRGVYWEPERDTLIAIPLFIFMGIMLQRSKIAENLLITMAQLFGPVPGGLGISVVFVGALLAATTGIVGATVVAMGLISLPAMMRHNYSQPLATGVIAASGTLGQIIPPSIVLIILADQLANSVDQAGSLRETLYKAATGEISMPSVFGVTSTSAGEMFLGAFVPGIVLVLIYMVYILVYSTLRPSAAPAVRSDIPLGAQFFLNLFIALVPPLALIILVLGSIIGGIATVNQAGAIGATGAMLMASYRLYDGKKRAYWPALMALFAMAIIGIVLANYDTNVKNISDTDDQIGIALAVFAVLILLAAILWSGWRTWKVDNTLREVMLETAKATSLVFIILLGAAMLTAAFRAFGGEDHIRDFLNGLPGGFWAKFVIVMAVIFVLGFFLDFIEIAVVVVPIVAPILLADPGANVTAVWLGVMIGLNIQTSFLTPPFGFALFYLRGVASAAVKTIEMYKGVIPFILLQIMAMVIVGTNPALVNYLPARVSFLSETSPPPRNPRLQVCLDGYVAEQYAVQQAELENLFQKVSSLDLSKLDPKDQKIVLQSPVIAKEAFVLLADISTARDVVVGNSDRYRPLHREVRMLEAEARKKEAAANELKTLASRIRDPALAEKRANFEERMNQNKEEAAAILATIPKEWPEKTAAFTQLTKALNTAQNGYRRAADQSYQPLAEFVTRVQAPKKLAELDQELQALAEQLPEAKPQVSSNALNLLSERYGSIPGSDSVTKPLKEAISELRGGQKDIAAASAMLKMALAASLEVQNAKISLSEDDRTTLEAYELAMRNTLGVRSQLRMTRDQALFVASCSSHHEDISLFF